MHGVIAMLAGLVSDPVRGVPFVPSVTGDPVVEPPDGAYRFVPLCPINAVEMPISAGL